MIRGGGLQNNVTSHKGLHKFEDKSFIFMNKKIKLFCNFYLIYGGIDKEHFIQEKYYMNNHHPFHLVDFRPCVHKLDICYSCLM